MISKLPFKVSIVNEFDNYFILNDHNFNKYILFKLNQLEYSIYYNLTLIDDVISKCIYDFVDNDSMYLLFDFNDTMTLDSVKSIKILDLLESVFNKSSYEVTLKKKSFNNLNKIYRILDMKYTYFEFRIREIETKIIKDDLSWIILSKYNILLDSRIYNKIYLNLLIKKKLLNMG